mmetsp:Transcript_31174/g.52645  ORF Transcript_31174/g.52645 Transcript_31174/m.52645 type:complete len:674 (-) Transcript_31174:251-2272(-)
MAHRIITLGGWGCYATLTQLQNHISDIREAQVEPFQFGIKDSVTDEILRMCGADENKALPIRKTGAQRDQRLASSSASSSTSAGVGPQQWVFNRQHNGLGNQLFQYAFSRLLAESLGRHWATSLLEPQRRESPWEKIEFPPNSEAGWALFNDVFPTARQQSLQASPPSSVVTGNGTLVKGREQCLDAEARCVISDRPWDQHQSKQSLLSQLLRALFSEECAHKCVFVIGYFQDPVFLTPVKAIVRNWLLNESDDSGGGGGGAASQVVLGFDIEWFVTFEAGVAPRGVATVQLCSENCCVVFQTSSFTKLPDGKLPPDDLVNLLEDPTVLKVGVGAGRDAIKVKTDLGVGMQGVVNLEDIAAGKAVDRSGGMSLASLCASLLGRQLAKPPHLRLSNWETVPLTWAQLDYAALDAYAGLRCHQALQRVPNKPRPDPRPQTPAQNTLQSEPGSEACPHDPLLKNQGGSLLPSCGEDDDDEVLVPRREPLGRLAPSKLACWDMWALQGWSVAQVAEARSIKPGTAVGYVCDAVEAGYEYPWGRLGVPRDVEALVRAAAARAATAAAAASAKAEEKAGTTEEPPRTATETIPEGLGMAAEGEERSAIPASSQATQVMVRANTAQERSQVAVRCAPQMRAVREQLGESNTATPYWAVRAVLLHMDRTGCFGEMRQKPDA